MFDRLIIIAGLSIGIGMSFFSIATSLLANIRKPKMKHVNIFYGLSILFLLIFLWSWRSVFELDGVRTTMPVVDMSTLPYWLSGIGTLAVAITTIIATICLPHRRRPRFTLEFDNAPPYCRIVKDTTAADRYWLRIKVVNEGKSVAKQCIGKLVSIKENEGKPSIDFDPVRLHWAGTDEGKMPLETIDLAQGEPEYLDLFYVRAGNPVEAIICQDRYPRGVLNKLPVNTYKIQITIYADNAKPATKEYQLVFDTGSFDNIKDNIKLKPIL